MTHQEHVKKINLGQEFNLNAKLKSVVVLRHLEIQTFGKSLPKYYC